MTPLEYYDKVKKQCLAKDRESDRLDREAQTEEAEMRKKLGIGFFSREPGFACWSHQDLPGYFHDPREVAASLKGEIK